MADTQAARLAVLISGRGSNMLAILKACQSGELNAHVVQVISNRDDAAGLTAAANAGVPVQSIPHGNYANRVDFDRALHEALVSCRPDWIVLAGFMRILSAEFVERWSGRIVNIHPSLLPKYPGLNTHARAIEAGDTEAGASVHIVSAELDSGPVLAQARVAIKPEDSAESLAARVLQEEHALYIRALRHCISQDNGPISATIS